MQIHVGLVAFRNGNRSRRYEVAETPCCLTPWASLHTTNADRLSNLNNRLRSEVARPFDREAEAGNDFGGLIEITQRHHFHRTVHVPVGDADQTGCHTTASQLKLSGVVAGCRGEAVDLDRDLG
jgi:hypothetical protein